jgi:hypothetical protein
LIVLFRGARGPRLPPSRKPASEPAAAPPPADEPEMCEDDEEVRCEAGEAEECCEKEMACDDMDFISCSAPCPPPQSMASEICFDMDVCDKIKYAEEECPPFAKQSSFSFLSAFSSSKRSSRLEPDYLISPIIQAPNPRVKELEDEIEREKQKLVTQQKDYEGKIGQVEKELGINKQRLDQLQQALKEALAPPPQEDEQVSRFSNSFSTPFPSRVSSSHLLRQCSCQVTMFPSVFFYWKLFINPVSVGNRCSTSPNRIT